MRTKIILSALLVVTVIAAACLAKGEAMNRHTLWVVPWDNTGKVKIAPGDMVELWTKPLPLIAENLDVRWQADAEGRSVELVGQSLPHREGTMERLFFFKAFEEGEAALEVDLLGADNDVRETWRYEVIVKKTVPEE